MSSEMGIRIDIADHGDLAWTEALQRLDDDCSELRDAGG